MNTYTGWQYLLIDAANAYGHDKLLFEQRIEWATDNLDVLEDLALQVKPKDRPLYIKAVMAIRKAQAGKPTGHMVGLDAICSGIQIMSVLTGCIDGARATGLVDPDRRADAYTDVINIMRRFIPTLPDEERASVKLASVSMIYGSKAEPEALFGEDTPELNAFLKAMNIVAPGACELLEDLRQSWRPNALSHEWRLPDNGLSRVKVMYKVEDCKIEVDELNHSTFTYEYYINQGSERGLSNIANVTHSVDAYVLRSLVRRCNYDDKRIRHASLGCEMALMDRLINNCGELHLDPEGDLAVMVERYKATKMADIRILDFITDPMDYYRLSDEHLKGLAKICGSMLEHAPFPVITVHDDFKAHPNNCNWVRMHYRNILAELADSTVLNDILSQLYGVPGHFSKKSQNLSQYIYKSNYSLS